MPAAKTPALLDEPTSGLDPVVRRDVLRELLGVVQSEQRSVLFSTHITSDIERVADYVAILVRGRIVTCEETQVLLDRWRTIQMQEPAGGWAASDLLFEVQSRRGELVSGVTEHFTPELAEQLQGMADGRLQITPLSLDDILMQYVARGA